MKATRVGPAETSGQQRKERGGCVTFCSAIYEVYLKCSLESLENEKPHSFQEEWFLGIQGPTPADEQGSADLEGRLPAERW